VDPRIQRITANLLNRFVGVSSPAAPTVSITSPASGAAVGGTISVTATASDDVGVVGVQFRLDGAYLGAEDTTAPYSVSWNTTAASDGPHTLTAVARDAAGLLTASAPVTVTVLNTTAPPTVTSFTPTSGPVSTSVAISGANFAGATAVLFNGTSASFTVGSATTITATVPAGATSGPISVTTPGGTASSASSFTVGTSVSPVVLENQQPGSEGWQMWLRGIAPADDVGKQIKGYASAASVNKGESITFYVTVTPAQSYTMDVYRIGYYQGLGGRFIQSIGPLQGVAQPACPVDSVTGLIECDWTASYTLTVPTNWTSGVFVVMLTNAQGYQNYIPFVVRDDARRADLLFQQAAATFQAYNNYPDDGVTGKSLHDFNSYGASTVAGTRRAVKVSWNRPYAVRGAAQFFDWEIDAIRWLEHSGYDVKYATDVDTHQNSARLLESKAFLSVGNSKYWTKPMYDGVERARDGGIHLGFFSASAIFWQVRLEPSPLTRIADRVLVFYKDRSIDPVQGPTTTILWRDPFLNRPEQQLMGVQFTGQIDINAQNAPYVVTNSSHWMFAGTGMVDGDSVPSIVGYEMDSSMSSFPLPTSVAGTYQVLSQSPFVDSGGAQTIAHSSIYQAPSGAWVFGAGTTSWSWGLDADGIAAPKGGDPRIQRATANLLQRFGASPSP